MTSPFPGSYDQVSSRISYSQKTGAPRVTIEKSPSPPAETSLSSVLSPRRYSLSNTISNGNKGRSRSNSLKMVRQRLQSFSSISGGTNSVNNAINQAGFGSGTYSPRGSFDMHSFNVSTDDLTSEPGPDYVASNLETYNEILINYLIEQGLNINPLSMKSKKLNKNFMKLSSSKGTLNNIHSFLTGNGQILFVPYNPAKKREQLSDEANEVDDEGDDDDSESDNEENTNNSSTTDPKQKKNTHLHHNVTNHTFAVIIKLSKMQSLTSIVKAQYFADATTNWISGILVENSKGSQKTSFKEKYKVSKTIDWDLDLKNPDCFIPFKDPESNMDDLESAVMSTTSTRDSLDFYCSDEPTQNVRRFEVLSPNDYQNELDDNGKLLTKHESLFTNTNIESKNFQPGYYIFLLPVVYPLNTPESIKTPLASITHHLVLQTEKSQYIPSLLPPPTALHSTSPHHQRYDDLDIVDSSSISTSANTAKSFFKKIHRRQSSSSKEVKDGNGKDHKSNNNTSPVYEFEYELPIVRLPPSDATSTLNKSIYVNKIWNDSLNYELLLPKKYIQLSPRSGISDNFMKATTFVLQMKLIPLVKNLSLKRIKVNVVEKITYVSKDKKYETEVGTVDRTGIKERTATLLEIKTKEKGASSALNTQVIKGCVNDNLMTCCYNNGKINTNDHSNNNKSRSRSGSMNILHPNSKRMSRYQESSGSSNTVNNEDEETIITNPVKLQCPISFIANDDTKFVSEIHQALCKGSTDISDLGESGNGDDLSIFSVTSHNTLDNTSSVAMNDEDGNNNSNSGWLSKSPILSPMLAPKKSTANKPSLKEEEKNSEFSFYPDITFHNINIRHRLQICFRISKPDDVLKNSDGEPKMHHYEVIVDTPIVFVSPFCVQDNLELPSYDYAVKANGFNDNDNHRDNSETEFKFVRHNEDDDVEEEGLPTFEEAILLPSSPMLSSYSVSNDLSNTTDSTTMLSQSPFSIGSASPPASFLSHNQSIVRNDSVYFNNLDSLIQGDIIDDRLFSKKDIKPSNPGGQLSNLLKPTPIIPPAPSIMINGNNSGLELQHIPSRSSLEYYESDLPTYQAVMEEDSNNLVETMGLLSDDDEEERKQHQSLLQQSGYEDEENDTFDFESDVRSLRTLNDIQGLSVTQANRIL
ncbi:hypothetical protein CANARDRAFT_205045 [[Candida] arabinofermentans NRRL YB-2248]|uniref:Arrestin C-terminal-like domain-containing protein n=1 Tax=[Candida] arabinofermentans NRRL YB-2248 TaxID=983967 RepID=A0A1E4SSN5_9ASCO|nr:hypothetical protein CANARDRAFT_205045 [[Candida] arabinofermentans NRRL YB-2248]